MDKFPSILKKVIEDGSFKFPESTEYNYSPKEAFRACERKEGESRPVDREDFRSYAELGKKKGRSMSTSGYHSVSLNIYKEAVTSIKGFNFPPSIVAKGIVVDSGGPMSFYEESGHIHWWMYEDADVSSFKEE